MLMKKFLILSVCLLLSAISYAQTLPGGFSHIIDVGQYSDWGKGYLTITDGHFIQVNDKTYTFTYEIVDMLEKPFNDKTVKSVIDKTLLFKNMND